MSPQTPRWAVPFPRRRELGKVQSYVLIVGLAFVGALAVAVVYTTPGPSAGIVFWIPFGATAVSVLLYVLRYYAISVYYAQEEQGSAVLLSILIVVWGSVVLSSTAYGAVWLGAYAILLMLSMLKEQATIVILSEDTLKQESVLSIPGGSESYGLSPHHVAMRLAECQSALQHERDLMWVEAGLAVFLTISFATCVLGSRFSLPAADGSVVLATAALSVLIYSVVFLVLKIQRFGTLIDAASQAEN